MRKLLAVATALVFVVGTVLVGSETGSSARRWSVRGSGTTVRIVPASTMTASAWASGDTRKNPNRIQIVWTWESRNGRPTWLEYTWSTWCWNQSNPSNPVRNREKWDGRVDQWKKLEDGQSLRLDVPTFNRDFCEVDASGILNTPPAGRLTVKIRDR